MVRETVISAAMFPMVQGLETLVSSSVTACVVVASDSWGTPGVCRFSTVDLFRKVGISAVRNGPGSAEVDYPAGVPGRSLDVDRVLPALADPVCGGDCPRV